jgi:hypothetical protein
MPCARPPPPHIGNIAGRLTGGTFNIPNTSGAKVFSLAAILSRP